MPKKKSGKTTTKSRKSSAGKKTKKKAVLKKKTTRKKAAPKPKPRIKPSPKKLPPVKKAVEVLPGPQPSGIPPVEEPRANEEAVGVVTHYYSHLNVAVVQLNKGALRTGDAIHIKGHSTDFTQKVESMEYEHRHIDQVSAGRSFGLKVSDHAREHDIVYLVK